jgi:hypothetical protein
MERVRRALAPRCAAAGKDGAGLCRLVDSRVFTCDGYTVTSTLWSSDSPAGSVCLCNDHGPRYASAFASSVGGSQVASAALHQDGWLGKVHDAVMTSSVRYGTGTALPAARPGARRTLARAPYAPAARAPHAALHSPPPTPSSPPF